MKIVLGSMLKLAVIPVWATAIVVALAMGMGCNSSPDSDAPIATVEVHPGQGTFASVCAACHGVNGEGQSNWQVRRPDGTLPAPPLNGEGHTWHHGDGLQYRVVSQGGQLWEVPELPQFKSGMPAFGEQLSHEEIIDIIEYVKSLWAEREVRGVSIIEHQEFMSESDPFPTTDS